MNLKYTNELSNSKKRTKRRAWTPLRRKRQAQRCKETKPWTRSTGPKTRAGKNMSRENATKHGMRGRFMAKIRAFLTYQKRYVRAVLESCTMTYNATYNKCAYYRLMSQRRLD